MREPNEQRTIDRRRFLTGAGTAALIGSRGIAAQTALPAPIRIQTPDLAFADALERARASWSAETGAADLVLSIVPAEPASDSLLDDAHSGSGRFAGSFIPSWLMPDLVRDSFIAPSNAPPFTLPASIARLRSFGGAWYASDLDHDCDLLFFRLDLLDKVGLEAASTWEVLLEQITELTGRDIGGIGLPMTHAQQMVDHFASMAASQVLVPDQAAFWFDPAEMTPMIASDGHQRALDLWRRLGRTMPDQLRSGSNGDLWQALIDGSVTYLVASADFLPFALDRGLDASVLGVSPLPGKIGTDGAVQRVGNTTGASWGGVTMSSAGKRAGAEVAGFLSALATAQPQQALWTDRTTGITPAPASDAEVAAMIAVFAEAGWPEQPSSDWLDSLYRTFANPVQLPSLRIAETRRYLQSLEDRIVPFLRSGETSAAETLSAAATDWTAITNAIGVETQRELFESSLEPPPRSE